MAGRNAKNTRKAKGAKALDVPDRSGETAGAETVAVDRPQAFVEPSGGNGTANGAPSKQAQGYGTAQGASGATSGGADPGGSLRVSPAADGA